MNRRTGRRSLRALVAASVGALSISAIAVPGMAVEPSGPTDCPDILPVDEVTDGMLATGWTATGSSGGTETLESFDVEVIGLLQDGIAPGRDLIVVEASGDVIDDNGQGIWFGMSGSPVYYEGDLIGAVAYGLSWGPSQVGGLTPAEDMAEIPQTPTSSATKSRVPLTRSQRADIAAETNTPTSEVGGAMVQLKTPFSISGASDRAKRKIAKVIDKENLPLLPYVGGGTGATDPGGLETTDTAPGAGGSFAAALSYGDITFAGVGTTTMVCNETAVAFGHPFFWTGDAGWGAAKASAVTIVPDSLGGSYKLANVEATFGTVDQDRLAGISATVGDIPTVIPVVSTITDIDRGHSRTGETLAVDSPYVPYITFIHLLSNSDVVIDRIGPGSSSTAWTLTGKRSNGTPWSVTRTNRFASEWDITYQSLWEVEGALYRILGQTFEDVTLDSVSFDADYEKEVKVLKINNALVSRNDGPFRSVRRIQVKPGDKLEFRAILVDAEDNRHKETTTFTVPNRFRQAYLFASSGENNGGSIECFTETGDCYEGGTESKFDQLLAKIANSPKNNDLVMSFRNGRKSRRVIHSQDQVVKGRKYIRVVRKSSGGGSGEGEVIEDKM